MKKRMLVWVAATAAVLLFLGCAEKAKVASAQTFQEGYDRVNVGMSEDKLVDMMGGASPRPVPGEEGAFLWEFRVPTDDKKGEKIAKIKTKDGKVVSKELVEKRLEE